VATEERGGEEAVGGGEAGVCPSPAEGEREEKELALDTFVPSSKGSETRPSSSHMYQKKILE
jgi:hypothetical protein